eukprot:4434743-Pleurochrysis_carterae.AAC.2
MKTRRAVRIEDDGRIPGSSGDDETTVGGTGASLHGIASECGDENPAGDGVEGLAGALSGRGARTLWLRLSAMDDATGRMRCVGTTSLALGRRSAAVRRGSSAASVLGG